MEREATLLKSIAVETVIPENGTLQLPELLEDVLSSEDRSATGIVGVRKRELVFIGMDTSVSFSMLLLILL